MKLYNFHVTHQNQTKTLGDKEIDLPGPGRPVNIQVNCQCGVTHNLIGSEKGNGAVGGFGHGSVVPPNDPNSQPGSAADDEPSWTGNPGSPDPESPTENTSGY